MTTKTKVSRKTLEEAISKMVARTLTESNHFSAMRSIQHAATSTSMEFERNIVDTLGLMDPDHMQPDLQAKYFEIVSKMKDGLVNSVMDATKQLISFPRAEQQVKK